MYKGASLANPFGRMPRISWQMRRRLVGHSSLLSFAMELGSTIPHHAPICIHHNLEEEEEEKCACTSIPPLSSRSPLRARNGGIFVFFSGGPIVREIGVRGPLSLFSLFFKKKELKAVDTFLFGSGEGCYNLGMEEFVRSDMKGREGGEDGP